MAAPKGNDHACKLKEPEMRTEAYNAYCEWIASGMPKEAFVYEAEDWSVTFDTVEKYMKECPIDFPAHKMKAAMAKRYAYWFKKGQNLVAGRQEDIPKENRTNPSPVTWSNIMRNMFKKDFGWDKDEAAVVNIRTSSDDIIDRITKGKTRTTEEQSESDDDS